MLGEGSTGALVGTPMSSYAQNKMYPHIKLGKTAFESGFCLFSMWISGIQLRLSNLMAKLFTCLTTSSIPGQEVNKAYSVYVRTIEQYKPVCVNYP